MGNKKFVCLIDWKLKEIIVGLLNLYRILYWDKNRLKNNFQKSVLHICSFKNDLISFNMTCYKSAYFICMNWNLCF